MRVHVPAELPLRDDLLGQDHFARGVFGLEIEHEHLVHVVLEELGFEGVDARHQVQWCSGLLALVVQVVVDAGFLAVYPDADAIIAAAKRNKVDLIVMASHGRKGIKRLLLGSETQHVLTHSGKPILVLR